jgi:hypothetical protein
LCLYLWRGSSAGLVWQAAALIQRGTINRAEKREYGIFSVDESEYRGERMEILFDSALSLGSINSCQTEAVHNISLSADLVVFYLSLCANSSCCDSKVYNILKAEELLVKQTVSRY